MKMLELGVDKHKVLVFTSLENEQATLGKNIAYLHLKYGPEINDSTIVVMTKADSVKHDSSLTKRLAERL